MVDHKKILLVLRRERGQMAIFIALIFQALFVLFAMVINVGMLVHDKINLQNSVDLAAYYAAQKQAEMLNAIAHQNYQVRQAWKLLAFRYWILASLSNQAHPSNPVMVASANQPTDLYDDLPFSQMLPDGSMLYPPQVCTISTLWMDQPFKGNNNENLCRNVKNSIKLADPPTVIIGAFNAAVASAFLQANASIGKNCQTMGAHNYLLGAQLYYGFRQDQANRRWVIRQLADQMSASEGDFPDLRGDSVFAGVQKVVLKNLTSSNREGNPQIALYNSLAQAGTREAWLQDILVGPAMFYSDTTECGGAVTIEPRPMQVMPKFAAANDQLLSAIGQFKSWVAGAEPNDPRDLMHSSVGVEKNPWFMAYVGVKATTQPRKPFSPFASSVQLTARGFAKPFGGRIGPWYGTAWPRGSAVSVGGTDDTKVDVLLPSRRNVAETSTYVFLKNLPNYSRYPGDRLGMNSWLTLRMLYNPIYMQSQGGGYGVLKLAWYNHLVESLGQPNAGSSARDGLAWDSVANVPPWVRNAEIASIAPNLFDTAYYSIDPDYYGNYFSPLSGAAAIGVTGPTGVRADLGSRLGANAELATHSVRNQINVGQAFLGALANRYFYQLTSQDHLLTAWSSDTATGYGFPGLFGSCIDGGRPSKTVPYPGDCIEGGRVGYSVKLVNRAYLKGNRHNYGNDGTQDTILNPPPDSF